MIRKPKKTVLVPLHFKKAVLVHVKKAEPRPKSFDKKGAIASYSIAFDHPLVKASFNVASLFSLQKLRK